MADVIAYLDKHDGSIFEMKEVLDHADLQHYYQNTPENCVAIFGDEQDIDSISEKMRIAYGDGEDEE